MLMILTTTNSYVKSKMQAHLSYIHRRFSAISTPETAPPLTSSLDLVSFAARGQPACTQTPQCLSPSSLAVQETPPPALESRRVSPTQVLSQLSPASISGPVLQKQPQASSEDSSFHSRESTPGSLSPHVRLRLKPSPQPPIALSPRVSVKAVQAGKEALQAKIL